MKKRQSSPPRRCVVPLLGPNSCSSRCAIAWMKPVICWIWRSCALNRLVIYKSSTGTIGTYWMLDTVGCIEVRVEMSLVLDHVMILPAWVVKDKSWQCFFVLTVGPRLALAQVFAEFTTFCTTMTLLLVVRDVYHRDMNDVLRLRMVVF